MKNNRKPLPKSKTHRSDISFVTFVLFLTLLGVLVVYNSTVIYSQNIYGNPYRFTLLHSGWVVLGLIFFFIFRSIEYKKLKYLSYLFFLAAVSMLGLLAAISILPCDTNIAFAPCVNGANRWIFLNPPPLPEIPLIGVIGFQPSEFAKLALVLYLSFQIFLNISRKENPFIVYLSVSALTALLILMQPNMSTAVMVFIIGTFVYISSGSPMKAFLVTAPLLLFAFIVFILISPYRRERLSTLVSGGAEGGTDSSYHINQISIALGSGGLLGVGFGESRQKYQYLPEVASDSIFAIIGEEFGYFGTTMVMIVFLAFIYKGIKVAYETDDVLAKMVVMGIISWIGMQFLINVAAMTKLIPLTGIPIPLISYGGSSLIFSMIGLGIVSNINRTSHTE